MKKILPITIVASILYLVFRVGITWAQESLSITAIPPRLELEALPEATLQETVKFRNESETELVVTIIITDFIVNDNQGTPIAVSEKVSGRWSLANWINTPPRQMVLAPNQTTTIDLVIAIPTDALPGGHYAMVTYEPVTEDTLAGAGSGSAIRPKVGTLIYLNVVGDVIEAANLKKFAVPQKFAHYGPILLSAEIENLGDVHFAPVGSVTVNNLLGDQVAQFELETKNIFPFASRTYDFEVPGKYRLGRYQAVIEATAGASAVPIYGLIYFWIVPLKEVAAAIIILIALITLIILRRRKKLPPQPEELMPEEPTITIPETPQA
jgi:hypothetical protein